MSIWHQQPDIDALNKISANTINERLDIRFTNVDEGSLTASMPVDTRTHQPFGILHGGASVVLAETVGSMAAYLCLNPDTHMAVGLDVNANHLRSVRAGRVSATARPVHLGRSTHVWAIDITDEHDKAVCVCRLTMAILDRTRTTSP